MSDNEERHTHKVGALEVNDIDEKGKKSMKLRIIIALVLVAVMLPCAVFGGWFMVALVVVIGVIAGYEIFKAPQKKFPWWVAAFTIGNIIVMSLWPIIYRTVMGCLTDPDYVFSLEGSFIDSNGSVGLFVQVAQIVIMLFVYFWIGVASKHFDFSDTAFFFTMTMLLGLSLQSALVVRFMPYNELKALSGTNSVTAFESYFQSLLLLAFVAISAIMNDTFAYFVGVLFGKHKMNEKISPKKTWEGFFGGWIFGAGFALLLGLTSAFLDCPMLPGIFDKEHWYWIVVASILLPLVGDLGDLSFSYVKRHYGFKDYSNLLGPHGGILDRVDSWLFCSLAVGTIISIANFINVTVV